MKWLGNARALNVKERTFVIESDVLRLIENGATMLARRAPVAEIEYAGSCRESTRKVSREATHRGPAALFSACNEENDIDIADSDDLSGGKIITSVGPTSIDTCSAATMGAYKGRKNRNELKRHESASVID